jgi:hypothetical protein
VKMRLLPSRCLAAHSSRLPAGIATQLREYFGLELYSLPVEAGEEFWAPESGGLLAYSGFSDGVGREAAIGTGIVVRLR